MFKSKSLKKIGFSILIIFISNVIIFCQSFDHLADSLIRSTFNDKNGPGGVFMVAHHGKTVFHKSYGKANLELNVDMSTDQVFQIGSMTKQFTAVAIMMLNESGKLDLHKAINHYLIDYPNGDKITIHHLLTHTSGIKDFTKMKNINDIAQKEMTPQMLIDFFKNEPCDFAPGEKFEYNNSGYVILGFIIEKTSGMSYEAFIQNNIFSKLGMKHSRYATDRNLISLRAYGYQKKDTIYVNKTNINYSVPYASGALMSSANDMLLWQDAIAHHQLINAQSTAKVFSNYELNNGEKISYGYGWHLKEINSKISYEHGGSIFGFKSMGVYLPKDDIFVLGLSNCDCHSPTKVSRDIAALYLDLLK